MKESLPDPPGGAHCHGQGFSRRTLSCCIFQFPTSTSSGCKLPGCKQGCMLLEHWREWEDENFVRLLWEESFSHLFLKQDLFLFVSSGIMCFSNHCFMLPWQIGLMPLPVCICSPDFPQAPFLLDSCSIFLNLLLSLGFSQLFLPDSHSVFYAIYIYTVKVQISLYQNCQNQTPLTSLMLFYMPLKINILKNFPIAKRKPLEKANPRNINIGRLSA